MAAKIVRKEIAKRIPGGQLGTMIQNSTYSLLGFAIPMLVAVGTMPFLVSRLGNAKFGLLSIAWVLVGYFSIFDLGIGRALTRSVAMLVGEGSVQEMRETIGTGMALLLFVGALGTIVCILISGYLAADVFQIPSELRSDAHTMFLIVALAIPLTTITSGARGILEAHQRFRVTMYLRVVVGATLYVAPLLGLLISSSLTMVAVTLVVSRIISCVWALACCRIYVPDAKSAKLSMETGRSLLRIGGWMTVSNVVSPLMVYSDRFLLAALVPISSLVFYTVPSDTVTRFLFIAFAVFAVVFPLFSKASMGHGDHLHHWYFQGTSICIILMFPVVAGLYVLAPLILDIWMGAEFARQSALVTQVLAIGLMANGVAQIPSALLQALGRADITARLHLVEFPIYLGAFWFAGSRWGIQGAAIAWTFRVIVDLVALLIFGDLVTGFDECRRLLAYTFCPLIVIVGAEATVEKLVLRVVIAALCGVVVYGYLARTVVRMTHPVRGAPEDAAAHVARHRT